ncbi:MAG TPA: hypothetical protein VN894_14610, partial [Polyangiaceae bacterium]|nr:hypothetical protein [Polyangiaceae bacterium]
NPSIAVSRSDSSTIYVSSNGDDGFHGVFKSTNRLGAMTWSATGLTPTTGGAMGTQNGHDGAMGVSPTSSKLVIASAVKPWISSDGGASWNLPEQLSATNNGRYHADVHIVAFFGSSIIIGTDGGISVSPDSGKTWDTTNDTIPIMNEEGFSVSGDSILAASWDTGIHWSTDHGDHWAGTYENNVSEDTSTTFISSSTKWFEDPATGTNDLMTSSNQGVSWATSPVAPVTVNTKMVGLLGKTYATGGPGTGGPQTQWNGIWVVDDGNGGNSAYAASQKQFTSVPTTMTAFTIGGGHVVVIAGAFYNGGSPTQDLMLSQDGGPWKEIGQPALPTDIVAIRRDSDTNPIIYVLTSSGRVFADYSNDVLHSITIGRIPSWLEFTGNLPSNLGYADIIADHAQSTAYVATNLGVFASTNSCLMTGGLCLPTVWQRWSDGLPLAPAQVNTTFPGATSAQRGDPGTAVMAFDAQTRSDGRFYIYAATWNRGIWVRDATSGEP